MDPLEASLPWSHISGLYSHILAFAHLIFALLLRAWQKIRRFQKWQNEGGVAG
jgi:hypothetical protein